MADILWAKYTNSEINIGPTPFHFALQFIAKNTLFVTVSTKMHNLQAGGLM